MSNPSESPDSSKVSLLSTDTTSSAFAATAKGKGKKNYLSALSTLQKKYQSATSTSSPTSSPTPSSSSSPVPSMASSSNPSVQTHPSPSQTTLVNPPATRQQAPKNYEAAFGQLATSYGAGGHAPLVKKKKNAAGLPAPGGASSSSSSPPASK